MSLPILNSLEISPEAVEGQMKDGYTVYAEDYGEYNYVKDEGVFRFSYYGLCDTYDPQWIPFESNHDPTCVKWKQEPYTQDFKTFTQMLLFAAFHNVYWG